MKRPTFPTPFSHNHPPVQNVNAHLEAQDEALIEIHQFLVQLVEQKTA